MKTIAKAVSVLCLGSVLCLAESWSGKVVDAACKDQAQAPAACEPTASTAVFGIELSDGKVLKLDNAGNAKATEVTYETAISVSSDWSDGCRRSRRHFDASGWEDVIGPVPGSDPSRNLVPTRRSGRGFGERGISSYAGRKLDLRPDRPGRGCSFQESADVRK